MSSTTITRKIAIVTGASSGLGARFVRELDRRAEGIDEIWAIARREDRLVELARDCGRVPVRPVRLDLAGPDVHHELGALLEEAGAHVSILVNNAGYCECGAFRDMAADDIPRMIDLNVRGMTLVNYACLPHMRPGSYAVVVGSVSGFAPIPGQAVYSATKAFVKYQVLAIREELKGTDINFMLLTPGNMDTEMNVKGGGADAKAAGLPYLDVESVASASLKRAAAGRATYTPGALYLAYRAAAKLLPSSLVMNINARAL